ncbi:MAG: TonB-dependent receptor [Sphingobium sp.]|nr:TonB-dependent receptor [Sphingobium sp.]
MIFTSPASANPPGRQVKFDIEAQALQNALREAIRQSGASVLFLPATVANTMSPAVRGKMPVQAALSLMIRRNASLELIVIGPSSFLIRASRQHDVVVDPPVSGWRQDAADATEQVIVTARKRPELKGGLAESFIVVQDDGLSALSPYGLGDAIGRIGGLQLIFTGTGQQRLSLRGLQGAGENMVGYYFDEIPISGPNSATSDVSAMTPDLRWFDMSRVEVLRGPQGTLYGAGSVGGTIRLLPAKPDTGRSYAFAELAMIYSAEGMPGARVGAVSNLSAVNGQLGIRLAGYAEKLPGAVDNIRLRRDTIDESRTQGLRASVTYSANENLSLDAVLAYQDQHIYDTSLGFAALGVRRTDYAERLPFPNDFLLGSITVKWSPGPVNATLVAGRYRWRSTRFRDITRGVEANLPAAHNCVLFFSNPCTEAEKADYRAEVIRQLPAVNIQPMEVRAQIYEARLSSAAGAALGWTVGVFSENRDDASVSTAYPVDAGTGQVPPMSFPVSSRAISMGTRQGAVFGELNWKMGADITFTIGGRRYAYKKYSSSEVQMTSMLTNMIMGPPVNRSTHAAGFVGKANVAYQVTPSLVLYATEATGFRPGGVNTIPSLDAALVEFAPDTVRSHELGARLAMADDRLNGSVAMFQTQWRNMQIATRIPGYVFVLNGGDSTIRGIEADVEWAWGSRWAMAANLSVLDAKYSDDQPANVAIAPGRKGDRLPYIPSVGGQVRMRYAMEIGGVSAALSASVEYRGRSRSEPNPKSPYYEEMGDFTRIGLGMDLRRNNWRVVAQIDNLMNIKGTDYVESFVEVERLTHWIPPRTFTVMLQRRF